jgi:hypothetical protein
MPLSGHRSQSCAVDQQVNPRTDHTAPRNHHGVLFAPVKGTVAFQQIEGVQGAPVYGEQFAPDGECARPDRGREVAQIEQVEVAASRAGAENRLVSRKWWLRKPRFSEP